MSGKPGKERTTNFKTYESQARLLAAFVATLPKGHRIDYKNVALHYGGEATESAIEHRFRPVKVQAEFIRDLVRRQLDPLSADIHLIRTQADIQKYFGESTADGLAFQFRSVKKGADALKAAADDGKSPVAAFQKHLNGATGSAPSTPSAKRTASVRTSATPSTKRRKAVKIEPVETEFDDDEDSPEANYSELDTTPTKTAPHVKTTPRKFPELVPHSAWAKPADKKPVRRNLNLAPAPSPRSEAPSPAAPSYSLASIAGVSSYNPPNGYTDPATGLAYGAAPSSGINSSASPSVANSPAPGPSVSTAMRHSSAFSNSAASSPATPNMPYAEQSAGFVDSTMTSGMGITPARTNPTATTPANGTSRTDSIQIDSSPVSASGGGSPSAQTTASSRTLTPGRGMGMVGVHAPVAAPAPNSFDMASSQDFSSSFMGYGAIGNGLNADALYSQSEFVSIAQQEDEDEAWMDAGDC